MSMKDLMNSLEIEVDEFARLSRDMAGILRSSHYRLRKGLYTREINPNEVTRVASKMMWDMRELNRLLKAKINQK